MQQQWKVYEKICNNFNLRLGKRILRKNHRGRRVEKTYNMLSNVSRIGFYLGELAVVMIIMGVSFIFGSGESLNDNTTLVYPLHKVSTLECRTMKFDTMPEKCKIELPIIHNADFDAYKNNKDYTDIYTTHWGASYTSGWDNTVGTHYGTDIATAWGTPLYAIADGIVFSSTYNSAYGNVVKIKFKFKGEILYAVYAHMSERLVENGEYVKAGQMIGKVGNSGNVFWALGWYHVHFEIDKDNNGRPAYVFNSCPTISKGDYAVIEAGECRMQLFQYTKDPIVLLESVHAKYPTQKQTSEPEPQPLPENPQHGSAETGDVIQNPDITPIIPDEGKTWKEEGTKDNDQISPSLNPWQEQQQEKEPKEEKEEKPEPTTELTLATEEVALNFDELDYYGKEFLDQYNVVIKKNFTDEIALEDQSKYFSVEITNKRTGEPLHGTLSQPLIFIASNTNVSLDPVSTTLIVKGNSTVKIAPKKQGATYLLIMLGTSRIGGVTLSLE